MRTRERAGDTSRRPDPTQPGLRMLADRMSPALAIVGMGLAVAGFFLALYLVKRYAMPIGWDTPRYLSQTTFVADRGLTNVPATLPFPGKTLASRAGFPVMVLSLSSFFAVSTFKMAATVPVAAAAALAMAAGAFVSVALRRPAWEAVIVAGVVGLSPVVIRLMAPETYTDNLLAGALFTAALVPILCAVRGGAGFWPAVLLVGAGGIAHAPFLAVFLAVLALTAVAYLPASRRARRTGTPLVQTPSARVAAIVGGGAAVAGAALLAILRTAPDTFEQTRMEVTKKFHQDLRLYLFPATLPLGALGVGSLLLDVRAVRAGPEDRRGRPGPDGAAPGAGFALLAFLAWTLVAAAGVGAYLLGWIVPAHRFLALLVPLPILVALGLLFLVGLVRRLGGRAVATFVLLLGLAGLAVLAYRDLYVTLAEHRVVEWMEIGKVRGAATMNAYLEAAEVPPDAPVVVVIDDTGPNPVSYVPEMAYIVRSVLPAGRIEHTYFYVGDPERYLAGEPTFRDQPVTYNRNARRFWPDIERLLSRDPVAVLPEAFNPSFDRVVAEHPDWVVAPGVIALHGPRPAEPVAVPAFPTGPTTFVQGVVLGAGTLLVLVVVGLGWALALLPERVRAFEAVGVAPAFGIAFLLVGGILVDAAGIRLAGVGGGLTVAGIGVAGWTLGVMRLRQLLRHEPDRTPVPPG